MVSSRSQTTSPDRSPRPRHRANPLGLGRLLILVFTVGLLSMAHGLFWWAGLLLLGFILLAVSRQGAWWGAWSASLGLLSLTFWHYRIIPVWLACLILAIGGVQFAWSLLRHHG